VSGVRAAPLLCRLAIDPEALQLEVTAPRMDVMLAERMILSLGLKRLCVEEMTTCGTSRFNNVKIQVEEEEYPPVLYANTVTENTPTDVEGCTKTETDEELALTKPGQTDP
jgi:hypothetical protein